MNGQGLLACVTDARDLRQAQVLLVLVLRAKDGQGPELDLAAMGPRLLQFYGAIFPAASRPTEVHAS